jgi:hypothetical protein
VAWGGAGHRPDRGRWSFARIRQRESSVDSGRRDASSTRHPGVTAAPERCGARPEFTEGPIARPPLADTMLEPLPGASSQVRKRRSAAFRGPRLTDDEGGSSLATRSHSRRTSPQRGLSWPDRTPGLVAAQPLARARRFCSFFFSAARMRAVFRRLGARFCVGIATSCQSLGELPGQWLSIGKRRTRPLQVRRVNVFRDGACPVRLARPWRGCASSSATGLPAGPALAERRLTRDPGCVPCVTGHS